MLKIRRSWDRLIFNMGVPILVRRYLYIEMAPWPSQNNVHFICKKATWFCFAMFCYGHIMISIDGLPFVYKNRIMGNRYSQSPNKVILSDMGRTTNTKPKQNTTNCTQCADSRSMLCTTGHTLMKILLYRCCIVTLNDVIDLDLHWITIWLLAWRHQVIT